MFIFLPIVLLLYYAVPKKLKNLFILISGLIFYAWGEPIYVVIMIASTLIDYTAGLMIYKFDKNKTVRLTCSAEVFSRISTPFSAPRSSTLNTFCRFLSA